jgi:putative ABC transport system permease protein
MIRLLRYTAWRRLRSDRLRAVITLLGIALGVAVVLAIELANRATTRSVETMVETIAGRARLAVRGDEAGFPNRSLRAWSTTPAWRRRSR